MRKILQKVSDGRVRESLRYSIIDGILWSAMYGMAENYIVPFALLFGATVFQTSLIPGISQLSLGIGQLAGAKFIIRFRKRRELAIWGVRIQGIIWILTFFATVLTGSVWAAIVAFSIGLFATNFGAPAWNSWQNELVPEKMRGFYWGGRNRIVGFAQFTAITFAGVTLFIARRYHLEVYAFGFLFIASGIFRFFCSVPLSRQHEDPMPVPKGGDEFHFHVFLAKLVTTNFGRFVLFVMLMNFAVYIGGALVPVYMMKELKIGYLGFTLLTMTSTILALVLMPYWGPLADRFGNRKILLATAMVFPFLILGWVFFKDIRLLFLIQVTSGFAWAGFNLCVTNFIFDAVRPVNMSKIMAYYNTLNTLCIFLGSITGGALAAFFAREGVSVLGYGPIPIVFAISFAVRIAVFLALFRRFKEVRPVEPSPSLRFFYFDGLRLYAWERIKPIGLRIAKLFSAR